MNAKFVYVCQRPVRNISDNSLTEEFHQEGKSSHLEKVASDQVAHAIDVGMVRIAARTMTASELGDSPVAPQDGELRRGRLRRRVHAVALGPPEIGEVVPHGTRRPGVRTCVLRPVARCSRWRSRVEHLREDRLDIYHDVRLRDVPTESVWLMLCS